MKKLLLLTTISTIVIVVLLANRAPEAPNTNPENGVVFFTGSWSQVLEAAKKEDKPIFLDIYATWCGPCKQLKRSTFTDKNAGNYYNKQFINVPFDGEQGDGAMLAQKYHITGYPTLLYLDKNGNPIFGSAGFVRAKQFIKFGELALQKNKK